MLRLPVRKLHLQMCPAPSRDVESARPADSLPAPTCARAGHHRECQPSNALCRIRMVEHDARLVFAVTPVRVAEFGIFDTENRCSEEGSIDRAGAADGECTDGNACWHLRDAQK